MDRDGPLKRGTWIMKNLFVVDLRGLDLPADQASKIEASIQNAALGELAGLRTIGKRADVDLELRYPKEWYGLWLRKHAGAFNVDTSGHGS